MIPFLISVERNFNTQKMKATILITIPFLVPCGTKVRLVRKDGFTVEGFFDGYTTYHQSIVTSAYYDLFPIFRAANRDGSMGKRYVAELSSGTISPYELKDYEMEILEWRTNYPGWDNKYSEVICDAVAACTVEMLTYAKMKGISRIELAGDPDIEEAHTTFEVEGSESRYETVTALEFDQEEKRITVLGSSGGSGYLDCVYGDGFDVGNSLPHIYKTFCQVLRRDYFDD